MTKAHTYKITEGKDGYFYYFIDGKQKSKDAWAESWGRSQRVREQPRVGHGRFGATKPKGTFEARERLERFPDAATEPQTVLITRERVRGSRNAVLVRHVLPMDRSEAMSYLEGQYDRGGNYVLKIKSVRMTRVLPENLREDEDIIGEDGSADES